MNKKQLRELPWRTYGKVRCDHCGMIKWTCTIINSNPATAMTTHVSNTARCCDNPRYFWTDEWRHDHE